MDYEILLMFILDALFYITQKLVSGGLLCWSTAQLESNNTIETNKVFRVYKLSGVSANKRTV